MGTDYYVTSRKWEEKVQEERVREREKAKVIVSGFANLSLQKGAEIANGDKVIEDAETRPNGEPADAVKEDGS